MMQFRNQAEELWDCGYMDRKRAVPFIGAAYFCLIEPDVF